MEKIINGTLLNFIIHYYYSYVNSYIRIKYELYLYYIATTIAYYVLLCKLISGKGIGNYIISTLYMLNLEIIVLE